MGTELGFNMELLLDEAKDTTNAIPFDDDEDLTFQLKSADDTIAYQNKQLRITTTADQERDLPPYYVVGFTDKDLKSSPNRIVLWEATTEGQESAAMKAHGYIVKALQEGSTIEEVTAVVNAFLDKYNLRY